MAKVHGRHTVVSLNAVALTATLNTSEKSREADEHDVTTYGKDAHVYEGGLLNGEFTMGGFYDTSTTNGPRTAIEPLIGTVVELIFQPEGTGTGKPTDTVDVLVRTYTETHPVADMVAWSATLRMSDDLVTSTQTS